MYLEHFGLREAPFRITPHTEFFFAGANRGATLEALIYAITHDEGIVKVSGEVGSGKTMLCRMLLEKLPESVQTVYLANPSLSRIEILHAIAEELDSQLSEHGGHRQVRELQERLLELYAQGRQVVVMIDEAHAMPNETLEEIRLLSNLESSRHKLLHIVLFGQPELDDRLAQPDMRQLKERITHNFGLEPLRRSDIGEYLMFRMRAAGYHGPDLFAPQAVQLIAGASEGLTRRINILADKALLSAFSENRHQIDKRQVVAAIRDAQFTPMQPGGLPSLLRKPAFVGTLIITVLAFLAGAYWQAPKTRPLTQAPEIEAHKQKPSPATTTPTVATTELQHDIPASATTAPSAIAGEQGATSATPPTLEQRIAATDDWLRRVPTDHYFIQLLSTDGNNEGGVGIFLEAKEKILDPALLRVYRSRLSGRERLGVIYGDYSSLAAAQTALRQIEPAAGESAPYIRSVSKLR